jgi:c-di-GMP-binding flagellar brake protein YcgR
MMKHEKKTKNSLRSVMTMLTEERRSAHRFSVCADIRYGSYADPFDAIAKSGDISFVGARLFVNDPKPIGTELFLTFVFPQLQCSFKATAVVVWERSAEEEGVGIYEIGTRFSVLDERNRECLYQYIFAKHRQELMRCWWGGIS